MPIPILSQPPGKSDSSYVIPVFGGELWTIPTSNSVMRMLVTEKESKGDFAVVSTGGQGEYQSPNPFSLSLFSLACD
jgi:hypothetical protein